jgi:phosphoribosylaminoimidazole carboxylase (NCAIR synthetase)
VTNFSIPGMFVPAENKEERAHFLVQSVVVTLFRNGILAVELRDTGAGLILVRNLASRASTLGFPFGNHCKYLL